MRGQVLHAAVGQHFKGLLGYGHVVFGQVARIGSGVGQGLVALVQALRQRQRGFGRITELAVGFTLQRGQVKQARAGLGGGRSLFGDGGFLPAHRIGND